MPLINKGLDGIFHSLLPHRLQTSLRPNTAIYIRARALTIMLVLVTALGAFAVLALVLTHLLGNPAMLMYDLTPAAFLLMLVLQTWLFYRYANYWISGLAFTNFYFLVIALMLILNGGYESHAKALLLTCPMMSFVIGGRQEGIQNACVSILFFWALAFLYAIEFKLPNLMFHQHDAHLVFALDWVFSLAVIAITLLVYEVELQGRDDPDSTGSRNLRALRNENMATGVSQKIDDWLHGLLPAALRNTLDKNSVAYTRAKILAVLVPVATLMCFIVVCLLLAIDLGFHPEQLKYDVMIMGVVVGFGLQTWLFYRYANIDLSGLVLGYFTFGTIVGTVLITGGYVSPVLVLLMICPVAFFMTGGIRNGMINAVLVAAIGLILAYLNYTGHKFFDYLYDAVPMITTSIAWFVAIFSIMICMMIYDRELEKL